MFCSKLNYTVNWTVCYVSFWERKRITRFQLAICFGLNSGKINHVSSDSELPERITILMIISGMESQDIFNKHFTWVNNDVLIMFWSLSFQLLMQMYILSMTDNKIMNEVIQNRLVGQTDNTYTVSLTFSFTRYSIEIRSIIDWYTNVIPYTYDSYLQYDMHWS